VRIPMAKKVLAKAFENNFKVMLIGPPGCGKSAIIEQVCQEKKIDYLIVNCAHMDPTDINGLPIRTGEKTADFAVFSDLQKLTEAKKPLVAVFEEIAQATPAVQAALMQVWHPGIIGGKKISKHTNLVACGNRASDKSAARPILEALKSRCDTILSLDVMLEDWEDWALVNNIDARGIAFLRFTARGGRNFLNDWQPTNEVTNSPCPRSVVNAFKWMEVVDGEALYECVKGAAGEAFATELIGFLEVYERMPDPEECIKNPERVTIPDAAKEPAIVYALTGAVGRLATQDNFANVILFSDRLPREFQVLLMRDAVKVNPSVCKTEAFRNWVIENKDLVD